MLHHYVISYSKKDQNDVNVTDQCFFFSDFNGFRTVKREREKNKPGVLQPEEKGLLKLLNGPGRLRQGENKALSARVCSRQNESLHFYF